MATETQEKRATALCCLCIATSLTFAPDIYILYHRAHIHSKDYCSNKTQYHENCT